MRARKNSPRQLNWSRGGGKYYFFGMYIRLQTCTKCVSYRLDGGWGNACMLEWQWNDIAYNLAQINAALWIACSRHSDTGGATRKDARGAKCGEEKKSHRSPTGKDQTPNLYPSLSLEKKEGGGEGKKPSKSSYIWKPIIALHFDHMFLRIKPSAKPRFARGTKDGGQ